MYFNTVRCLFVRTGLPEYCSSAEIGDLGLAGDDPSKDENDDYKKKSRNPIVKQQLSKKVCVFEKPKR